MERVVVDDMAFLQRHAHVDDALDDAVGDDEALGREELGSLLEFVDFELAPQPFHVFGFGVSVEP